MRIAIDMQGAQSGSRLRGIGRYTLSLAKAIVRNRRQHEVFLILNDLFPESVNDIREAFKGILPKENILLWYAPGPTKMCEPQNIRRQKIARLLQTYFIQQIKPDLLFIPSFYEGYAADTAIDIGNLTDIITVVTVHDLIPLLNPADYIDPKPGFKGFYDEKTSELKKADYWFPVSVSSAKEAQEFLALPAEKMSVVYNACDDVFRPITLTEAERAAFMDKWQIKEPFILYCGGADPRKNLFRLIEAFSLLPEETLANLSILIIGYISKIQLEQVLSGKKVNPDKIVFAEYVSDEDLAVFYNLAALFIMPSYHEGFGLPILEAMSCGTCVIGSNTTSIPEVLNFPEALFDPYEPVSIRNKIVEVLTDSELSASIRDYGIKRAKDFSWDVSATKVIQIFERLYNKDAGDEKHHKTVLSSEELLYAIANEIPHEISDADIRHIAYAIDLNNTVKHRNKRLYVDISELVKRDAKTGIQRVTRSILNELLKNPPPEYEVCPIYAETTYVGYRHANTYIKKIYSDSAVGNNDLIEFNSNDVFLGLDYQAFITIAQQDFLKQMKRYGVNVYFLLYDLLPVDMPQYFNPGATDAIQKLLPVLANFDGVVCISKTVADRLEQWYEQNSINLSPGFRITWSHNGADIENSLPTMGIASDAEEVLKKLSARQTFLCVGTIEPRKAHEQVLSAFELLWKEGADINLVFVGASGWKTEKLIKRIQKHPELNSKFYWFKGISDEYLEKIYGISTCLIAASYGEGFGLPLIEAARYNIPIIARDIPIFREIAGEHAYYFTAEISNELSVSVKKWIELYENSAHPLSKNIQSLTWQQSTKNLIKNILSEEI